MKKVYLLSILLLNINASATIWAVEAGGGGMGNPDPYFSPNALVITVGDTVQWNNVQGNHSVDGTDLGNPESFMFDNDDAPWTFEHQFTIPGSYYVECSVSNHAITQNMTIEVMDVVDDLIELEFSDFMVFPNPLSENSTVTLPYIGGSDTQISVFDVTGRLFRKIDATNHSNILLNRIDFESGIYILALYQNQTIIRKTQLLVN